MSVSIDKLQAQYDEDPSLLSLREKLRLPDHADLAKEFLANRSKASLASLTYDFGFNARPKQIAPEGKWSIWFIQAGRGFGKSYAAAGWVKTEVHKAGLAGKKIKIGIIGDVYQEVETKMVQAILDMYAPNDKSAPTYSSKSQMIIWKNGCVAHVVQAEVPKKLRGYNFDIAWVDELAKFQYINEAWAQLMQCVRKGDTKILISTTPARGKANRLLREIKDNQYGQCIVTRGSQKENLELSEDFINRNILKYTGTKFGAQEIDGVMLDDVSGALWSQETIKHKAQFIKDETERAHKLNLSLKADWMDTYIDTQLKQIVIAVDPATTSKITSDETGIIVCARDHYGRGFVLEDKSGKHTPNTWATIVSDLYNKYKSKAKTMVVAESNQGGDMIKAIIFNVNKAIPIDLVNAYKGKILRAEPIGALYEQGKVYHLGKNNTEFEFLEYQMCNYTGNAPEKADQEIQADDRIDSPDRMDAMVYGFRQLFSELFKDTKRGPIPFKFLNF